MNGYTFVKRVAKGVVILRWAGNDETSMWTLVKLREPHTCRITGKALDVGDMAWKPVTNKNNRMHRIGGDGMRKLDASNVDDGVVDKETGEIKT